MNNVEYSPIGAPSGVHQSANFNLNRRWLNCRQTKK